MCVCSLLFYYYLGIYSYNAEPGIKKMQRLFRYKRQSVRRIVTVHMLFDLLEFEQINNLFL